MRKKLSMVMLLAVMVIQLAGCSSSANVKQIDLQELRTEIMDSGADLPKMEMVASDQEEAQDLFRYLSDFPYEQVQDYFFLYSGDSANAGVEIAVVQAKDQKQVDQLKESLLTHLEERKRTFRTYAPDQLELVENAKVMVKGTYVTVIVTKENQKIETIINQSFEQ